ncbi:MAG: rubrerythrin [gamma proteobacterium symbiont of Ctena orbiculata]|uniref:Ferritin family protein n=1 Tax=Candidatus Thiodiazotropha taylori TaxID=2792791 RepID=A0A944QTT1_9GAMM|nr:ferritin family protein [Candidatus Thiodiazotropha taylori]PVV07656.1 MAG: rubrerythrin [gamma proteobacterium symbiont of Ctena orbiculata]MBT2988085.1 ferritin family protein [Candidatus Thiodiazotropha taylori]MBT2998848.1 ferritin family protein [Candidatus Thiodiazotropha taylori]MBT3002173.1 ferritin family protein [Candidatus Thiodiazotropha taylori]
MEKGQNSGYQKLQSKKSLSEILEVAIEFERTARDFYNDLIPKVSKQIRYLVEELAEEEQRHFDLFNELKSRPDIEQHIQAMVDTPASDKRFSDCIHLPDLGDKPDDQAVLQYALGREHAAMEQYHALAESTEPGPIKDLFLYLANEETLHKNQLERLYYETIHSGGV